jgi:hypothetical protein
MNAKSLATLQDGAVVQRQANNRDLGLQAKYIEKTVSSIIFTN